MAAELFPQEVQELQSYFRPDTPDQAVRAVPGAPAQAAERVAQSVLLRDVIGNPFRPVAASPAWRTWGGGVVVGLARADQAWTAIGAEVAVALALSDLIHKLIEAAAGDIEQITQRPAHLSR